MASAKPRATKSDRIDARVTPQDRELLEAAAATERQSLTQFLVESARERAERVLADRTTFSVGSEEWERLQAAMDRPAQVRPELVELFSRARPD